MMQPALEKWRDHIIDSFSDPPQTQYPLKFIPKEGEIPVLTFLKMGSTSGSQEIKGVKKRKANPSGESGMVGLKRGKGEKEVADLGNPAAQQQGPSNGKHRHTEEAVASGKDDGHTSNPIPSSLYLQLPNMSDGTLPREWRRANYDEQVVSCKMAPWLAFVLFGC